MSLAVMRLGLEGLISEGAMDKVTSYFFAPWEYTAANLRNEINNDRSLSSLDLASQLILELKKILMDEELVFQTVTSSDAE